MAEKKMQIDNIKIITEILKDGGLELLKNGFSDGEKRIKEFKALIDGRLSVIAAQRAAEAAKAAEEELKSRAEKTPVADANEVEPAAYAGTETETEPVKADSAGGEEQPVGESKAVKEPVAAETSVPSPEKEERKIPSFIVRREFVPDKNAGADKPKNRTFTPTDKPFGKKPDFKGAGQARRPQATYVAPPVIPTEDKRGNFGKKNSGKGEKNYEEKRTLNKRALIKNSISVDDFDENKTGYRKFRPVKKAKEQIVSAIKIEKAVVNSDIIPLKVLSEKIGITAAEITKRLFKEGIMKTINDSVDFDTAAFIADDIGVELELKMDQTAEDALAAGFEEV
ncbi:MAG: translation initiation factor IF-2 N-terminal domain-containing protein, partial [Clostridia bacterium]|nr:translation initiation factor IF-2 N-terminal domain-containing protein [Clostridia bacterium]